MKSMASNKRNLVGNTLHTRGVVGLPPNVSAMVVRFRNGTNDQVDVGCSDGVIRTFNTVAPFQHVGSLDPKESNEDADPCTNFRHFNSKKYAGQIMATYGSGKIRRWHVQTKSCLSTATQKNSGSLLAIDIRPDGEEFIVGGVSTILELFDTDNGDAPKRTFGLGVSQRATNTNKHAAGTIGGHSNRIHAVRYHPTLRNSVVSAAWDGNICFWDLDQDLPTKQLYGPFVCGDSIDFVPGSSDMLVGSYRDENALQVWDTEENKLKKNLSSNADKSWLYSCMFHPSHPNIVATAGCKTNELRLVEFSSGNTVGRVGDKAGLFSCHFSSDGSLLVGGGAGNSLSVCEVRLPPNDVVPFCPKLTEKQSKQGVSSTWEQASLPNLRGSPAKRVDLERFDLDPSDNEGDSD